LHRRFTTVSSHFCTFSFSCVLVVGYSESTTRLTSRGAQFNDGSLNLTYRNVSGLLNLKSLFSLADVLSTSASDSQRHRCSRGLFGRMGCGTPLHRKERNPGDLLGQVICYFMEIALFNDPSRNLGLTGAFLFASTTARSSVQLLGWNCGYVFFSNVRWLLSIPAGGRANGVNRLCMVYYTPFLPRFFLPRIVVPEMHWCPLQLGCLG